MNSVHQRFLLATLLSATALCASKLAQAQVAVVVGAKSPHGNMTAEQVSAIFLGKSNSLPGGAAAAAADLPESAAVREQFYSKVTGKSSAQVKAAWSRLVFSGKATPPKELGSAADVKSFVAGNPDAIGYIEKSAVDGSVKVVLHVD
jgi:ABC-type phosphate transport system substrate-binding protein